MHRETTESGLAMNDDVKLMESHRRKKKQDEAFVSKTDKW